MVMIVGKKSIQEMSLDTRTLLRRLLEGEVDEIIPYAELNELIKRNVQGEASYCLAGARRAALNQERVFGTIRGVGIKRLSDSELAGIGEEARKHIARTARKAMKKMTAVQNFETLSNEEKIRHNTSVSMLGAVAHIASSHQVKSLESKVQATMQALPLQKTLEAFMIKSE